MARPQSLLHPRDAIIQTMERIYQYRMTTTSGGNLSIRDEHGDIWITPARIDKGNLRREDIVCVHADGKVEGLHPPSSEFPFHRAIYVVRPEIEGIVHAHSVALVAFSICGGVPDTRLFHHARGVCGKVGFAPYALPGSGALAANIAASFSQGPFCVILENHGVVVGGENLQNAFQRFETLEFTAKTIIKATTLGPPHYLDDAHLRRRRAEYIHRLRPAIRSLPRAPKKSCGATMCIPAAWISQPTDHQHRRKFFGPRRRWRVSDDTRTISTDIRSNWRT